MATWVQGSGGNIVAVNIQYRLGLLGFLASNVLMQNGSANVGLLDQRAAIEWVKRYVNACSMYQMAMLTVETGISAHSAAILTISLCLAKALYVLSDNVMWETSHTLLLQGAADIVHQLVSYGGRGELPFQAAVRLKRHSVHPLFNAPPIDCSEHRHRPPSRPRDLRILLLQRDRDCRVPGQLDRDDAVPPRGTAVRHRRRSQRQAEHMQVPPDHRRELPP